MNLTEIDLKLGNYVCQSRCVSLRHNQARDMEHRKERCVVGA